MQWLITLAKWLLLFQCAIPGTLSSDAMQASKDTSTEALKENIKALYMNMDVPEVSPTDGTGTLNVSVMISEVTRLENNEIDLSFILDLRWSHKFLDVMSDSLEAIPLSRDKLWTPKFVFLNVRSVREEQSSLYLQLSGARAAKAIVYKIWHRTSVRCEGPSMQYPFSDTLCTMIFEEANPRSHRSIHLSLGQRHQHNCSHHDTGRHSIVFRLSKPFSSDGRKYQFWTRICIKSNLDDMSRAVRQYCLSLILVLYALTTLYFFDRTTRLLINLALLNILLFNWAPVGGLNARLNALDIWLGKCTMVICCCLLIAMGTADESARRRRKEQQQQQQQLQQQQREDQLSGRQSGKCSSGSYSGTFLMQPQTSSSATGLRNSKCTTISECSDHLDLFPSDPATQQRRRRHSRDSNAWGGSGLCRMLAKAALPTCWLLLVGAFWACMIVTAPRCESLLPECHTRGPE